MKIHASHDCCIFEWPCCINNYFKNRGIYLFVDNGQLVLRVFKPLYLIGDEEPHISGSLVNAYRVLEQVREISVLHYMT